MNHTKTSFLDLPLEIRQQIYHLSIPPSRLCTRPILDPEWLFAPDRGCKVNPLLFTTRQIYKEAAPLFYSRATLEVTPCQRNATDARHLPEFLSQYQTDHAFCPAEFLQRIKNVHVYGDQTWPVDQDSFQALFQWLVARTAARHVYLSRKTMQQNRHIPELICLNNLAYDVTQQECEVRVVDVYARNVSSRLKFWDGTGTGRNFHARVKPLPDVQLYLDCSTSLTPRLYREPRWDLLSVLGDGADYGQEELLRREMMRFAEGDLEDAYLRQAHVDGYLWLYKTIQIRRGTRFVTGKEVARVEVGSPTLAV